MDLSEYRIAFSTDDLELDQMIAFLDLSNGFTSNDPAQIAQNVRLIKPLLIPAVSRIDGGPVTDDEAAHVVGRLKMRDFMDIINGVSEAADDAVPPTNGGNSTPPSTTTDTPRSGSTSLRPLPNGGSRLGHLPVAAQRSGTSAG